MTQVVRTSRSGAWSVIANVAGGAATLVVGAFVVAVTALGLGWLR